MGQFVDLNDIGSEYRLLMCCQHRIADGDAESCLYQIERLARESPYEGVRASAEEMLRRHREDPQSLE
jgi:hypothetical protein